VNADSASEGDGIEQSWMTLLSAEELEYWEALSEEDKKWWISFVKPEDRASIIAADIRVGKTQEKLWALPEEERARIARKLEAQAEGSSERIRDLLRTLDKESTNPEPRAPAEGGP
jgi:hypothetical protein